MGRRIPIESDEPEHNDEEPLEEEPSVPPSQAKVRKAYMADEMPELGEPPHEGEPHREEEEESAENRLLRLAAEFENYKKRMERERALSEAYANEGLLERLLPVVDNLERALATAESGGDHDGLLAGIGITLREFLEVLRREGVEPIDAEGQSFDPTIHEAISTQPSAHIPEGSVISQVEKGYRYRERILRPAKVIVSSGPP